MEWINVATGERRTSPTSPGAGWVDAASTAGQIIAQQLGKDGPVLKQGPDGQYYQLGKGGFELVPGMPSAAPKAGGLPDVDYDPQGRAFYWTSQYGSPTRQYVPDLDDPTKAAGAGRGSGSLSFEQQMTLKQTPSSSYSVSQSLRDPADLALDRDSLAEKIRQAQVAEAADAEKLQFQRDVQRVNEDQGNKKLALDASALAESIQARIERSSLERQRMQQDLQMLDQRQQFEAEQGLMDTASRMAGQDADRASREQMASQEDATRRAGQAAEFAGRGATDFGKLGAFLGNGGISGLSTAMGQGQTAITDQSLEPLGALLQPAAPVQPAGSLSSYISMLRGLGFGQRPNQNPAVPPPAVPMAGAGGTPPSPPGAAIPNTDAQGNLVAPGGQAPQWQPTPGFQDGGAVVDMQSMNGLMQMAQMLGMQPKAIAGERGKANGETVYSNGDVVVMPDRGMGMPMSAGAGAMRTAPMPMSTGRGSSDKAGMPRMQEGGGVFGSLSPAWQYINKAGSTALKRANLTRPLSPVELSDPGTDPEMQELGASLAALTRGIPRRSYLNELMRLTPQGMQQGFARRTY